MKLWSHASVGRPSWKIQCPLAEQSIEAAATRSSRAPTSGGSERPQDKPIPIGRDAIAWAARALRCYEMPPDEISAVLGADNPELVRRYMELHRERLEERLADQLRALIGLERLLVQGDLRTA